MRLPFLISLILFIICPGIYSQVNKPFGTMPYKHYTSKQGLAGSNVLAFKQDKKGYIWFATTSGLTRFDGTDFKNFTTRDGLSSNNLTGIDGNENDSLFIATYDKGINVFYNGKFSNYEISNDKIPLIHHLIANNDKLFLYADYLKVINNHRVNTLMEILTNGDKRISNGFQIISALLLKNKDILFASNQGMIKVTGSDSLSQVLIPGAKNITSIYQGKNGTIWFGGYGEIWKNEGTEYKKVFENLDIQSHYSIQNILVDSHNNIWFSQTNGNVYRITDNKLIDIGSYLGLQKTQINFIREDQNGGIWIGTFGKGVYYFFNLSVTNYSTKDNLTNDYILSLGQDTENRILIGTFNGLDIIDNDKFIEIPTGFPGNYHYIRGIQRARNNIMYITATFEVKLNYDMKTGYTGYKGRPYRIINTASIFARNDDDILFGGWDNSVSVKNISPQGPHTKKHIRIFPKSSINVRTNKIVLDKNGTYWIATTIGLCKLDNLKPSYFEDDPVLNSNITDVEINQNGEVWAAGDKGVAQLVNNKWVNYTTNDNYDLTYSTSVTFDNDGNTWIGNTKGLFKIKNAKVSYYTDILGINSYEINVVYCDTLKNNLWIGTVEGLSRIDLNSFNKLNTSIPKIYIEEIRTSDSTYAVYPGVKFPDFNQTKITINFAAINFQSPENFIFEYKNESDYENNGWELTDKQEIQFASLLFGNNNILIRAKELNGEWGPPAEVNIFVKTPFIQSYWFYCLVMFILLVPAVFVSRMFLVKKQKKELSRKDVEKRIVELKQQALSAMMNPHFIFNSLNSIQNFINNHGKKEANLYLTSFAKLIRFNLDIAQKSYINMEEELERLELYLTLEKMRFGENFQYSIKIDKSVIPSAILIPNMIIQPFVENGIWHGILPNDKSGNLTVKICFTDRQFLVIQIEDDGVGYFHSLGNKKRDHISKGIAIIKERLSLLNESKSDRELVQIDSLFDEKSASRGTIVKISLPPKMYFFESGHKIFDR